MYGKRCGMIGRWIALSCCCGGIALAQEPSPEFRVAVLASERSGGEFDSVLTELSWPFERYQQDATELEALVGKLGTYDAVLWTSLFAWDFSAQADAFRKFVENGGALIIPDGNYETASSWLASLDPVLSLPREGFQAWMKPEVSDVAPPHVLRRIPFALKESGILWSHYALPPEHGWEVVAKCKQHDQPCFLIKRLGKGIVLVTNLRYNDPSFFENVRCLLALQREGIQAMEMKGAEIQLGRNELSLSLKEMLGTARSGTVQLSLQSLEDAKLVRNFTAAIKMAPKGNASVTIPYLADIRGPVRVSLTLKIGTSTCMLMDRTVEFPQLLTVQPPSYRGMVSTARRQNDIQVGFAIAPIDERLNGLRLKLTLTDEQGKQVFLRTVPTLALSQFIPLTMPKASPAGTYTLVSTLGTHLKTLTVSTNSIIIHPTCKGQVIVDQDGTLLSEGVPYFPLGLYHLGLEDIPSVVEMGLNSIQLFSWHAPALDAAAQAGLKVLWEQNHAGADSCRSAAENHRNHPSIGMWYVLDEPGDERLAHGHSINDAWRAADSNHPTYMVCNQYTFIRKQQAIADVFAIDPYILNGEDPERSLAPMAEALDLAQSAVPRGKPVMCVLQAFGYEPEPQFRAMAYLALTHDVRGLYWYCWSQAGGGRIGEGIKESPRHQAWLKQLTSEIKTLTPALVSLERRALKSDGGNIHALLCGNKATGRLLICVNTESRSVEETLALPELPTGLSLNGLLGADKGKQQKVAGGTLKVKLPPYGITVYTLPK